MPAAPIERAVREIHFQRIGTGEGVHTGQGDGGTFNLQGRDLGGAEVFKRNLRDIQGHAVHGHVFADPLAREVFHSRVRVHFSQLDFRNVGLVTGQGYALGFVDKGGSVEHKAVVRIVIVHVNNTVFQLIVSGDLIAGEGHDIGAVLIERELGRHAIQGAVPVANQVTRFRQRGDRQACQAQDQQQGYNLFHVSVFLSEGKFDRPEPNPTTLCILSFVQTYCPWYKWFFSV